MDVPSHALFADTVPGPAGWFTLDVFRNGGLVETSSGPNLVVVGAKLILAGVVGGARATPGVSQFAVGSSMTAAASGNTALTAPFAKAFDAVSYPVPGQVCFAFSLASGDANGLSIGEFGLLAPDGTLFARKVRSFSPLLKDPTMSLSGTWTIAFN